MAESFFKGYADNVASDSSSGGRATSPRGKTFFSGYADNVTEEQDEERRKERERQEREKRTAEEEVAKKQAQENSPLAAVGRFLGDVGKNISAPFRAAAETAPQTTPVTQAQIDEVDKSGQTGQGEKDFVKKRLVRDSLISQVASGKTIGYSKPAQGPAKTPSIDITKYLSQEEYDSAVKEGLLRKVQEEAGGTPVERAQQQVGGLDLLSMAQGAAQLPERVIRSGVELVTGQPASNFEDTGPAGSLIRTIYGKEGVRTYQQQGKDVSQLASQLTGNKDLDNPATQTIAALGLAGLDVGGLGLGKVAKSAATRALAATVAEDVGLQGVSKNLFDTAVDSAAQKAGRDLTQNEVKGIADRINIATTKVADKTPSTEAPIQTPLTQTATPEEPIDDLLNAGSKTSGSSLRLQQSAVERNLAQSIDELPTFQQRDLKANAAAAVKIVNDDPKLANDIIDGRVAVPEGTSQVAVHNAVIEKAFREGAEDVDLINKAARAETNREISIGAQNLREAQERYRNTPLGKIQELRDVRQAAVARRAKKEPAALVSATKDEVRASVASVNPKDWQSFVESLRC